MTKMLKVDIDTSGVDQQEATEWVNELANVYADMEIDDVKISGDKITFKAGFSGMDDTDPDDIKSKIGEYLTMNETFEAKKISVFPTAIGPNGPVKRGQYESIKRDY